MDGYDNCPYEPMILIKEFLGFMSDLVNQFWLGINKNQLFELDWIPGEQKSRFQINY